MPPTTAQTATNDATNQGTNHRRDAANGATNHGTSQATRPKTLCADTVDPDTESEGYQDWLNVVGPDFASLDSQNGYRGYWACQQYGKT